jgi:DNA-binding NarL/FixJ family response regulator
MSFKEGKNAIKWTRLSCRKFRDNEVRLQLHALAYNLANFMRTLALPKEVEHWSLTTLREKLVKIGDIPVLILTSHTDEGSIHSALDLGIQGYIAKPVSRTILENQIASALQTRPTDLEKRKR